MPSPAHEILVELFRHRPDLLRTVLALVGRTVPDIPGAVLRPAPAEVTGVQHGQYRADLVLHLAVPDSARPAHAFVVEIQLAPDPDKHFSWPHYMTGVRARERCPVTQVVLTLSERTARWAAAPITLDSETPSVVQPIVIGPSQIPRITDVEQARALPELAVLSAAAHGRTPGAEQIARAALSACAALDSRHQVLYADFVMARLGPEARRALESHMDLDHFRPQSDIGKRLYAEGRKAGMRAGRKRGREDALRSLLIKQLAQLFGEVPEAAIARIQSADADLLAHWGERLFSAPSLDAVFESAPEQRTTRRALRPGVRSSTTDRAG
jgi:hypothetical protein